MKKVIVDYCNTQSYLKGNVWFVSKTHISLCLTFDAKKGAKILLGVKQITTRQFASITQVTV